MLYPTHFLSKLELAGVAGEEEGEFGVDGLGWKIERPGSTRGSPAGTMHLASGDRNLMLLGLLGFRPPIMNDVLERIALDPDTAAFEEENERV